MKKLVLFFSMLAICFGLTSCTSTEDKVKESVNGFLNGYFAMDYDTAYTFCTSELAETLKIVISDREYVNDEIKKIIEEASKKTTFKIIKIDTESVPEEAFVEYEIYPAGAERSISKSLTVSKVNKVWKVSGMN
ncbi:MAG: hypothetical protein M0R23_07390 [Bacteroidales bacterium]|nr:hypothetical protein [Bacteroidales bacterium]